MNYGLAILQDLLEKFRMIKYLDLQQVTALHGGEIIAAVKSVVEGGRYLNGVQNEKFEENYSRYIGVKHTIGVANGLDALF